MKAWISMESRWSCDTNLIIELPAKPSEGDYLFLRPPITVKEEVGEGETQKGEFLWSHFKVEHVCLYSNGPLDGADMTLRLSVDSSC